MQQGRRTASLKASYEAINTGINPHELSIGRELAGAAQSAIAAAILPDQPKKQKRYNYRRALCVVVAAWVRAWFRFRWLGTTRHGIFLLFN
jgi:hypothetical protein